MAADASIATATVEPPPSPLYTTSQDILLQPMQFARTRSTRADSFLTPITLVNVDGNGTKPVQVVVGERIKPFERQEVRDHTSRRHAQPIPLPPPPPFRERLLRSQSDPTRCFTSILPCSAAASSCRAPARSAFCRRPSGAVRRSAVSYMARSVLYTFTYIVELEIYI